MYIFILQGVNIFTFSRCICGLLKRKPRILVTHQLQYLKAADEIVVLKEVGVCVCVCAYACSVVFARPLNYWQYRQK